VNQKGCNNSLFLLNSSHTFPTFSEQKQPQRCPIPDAAWFLGKSFSLEMQYDSTPACFKTGRRQIFFTTSKIPGTKRAEVGLLSCANVRAWVFPGILQSLFCHNNTFHSQHNACAAAAFRGAARSIFKHVAKNFICQICPVLNII
jgi:hypothetical protein